MSYEKELAEIKAAWGITSDLFDAKLQRLVDAADGNPEVQAIADLVGRSFGPDSPALVLAKVAAELKSLIATGKSVPRKNRSALA